MQGFCDGGKYSGKCAGGKYSGKLNTLSQAFQINIMYLEKAGAMFNTLGKKKAGFFGLVFIDRVNQNLECPTAKENSWELQGAECWKVVVSNQKRFRRR